MELLCFCLPTKNVEVVFTERLNCCYKLWKSSFSRAFSEISGKNINVRADSFLAQDEVIAIFNQDGHALALACLSRLNINEIAQKDQNHFSLYPETLKAALFKELNRIMFFSNLCVAPDFRAEKYPHKLSELVVGLALQRFLVSKDEALLAITRNDRKVNERFYSFGGKRLDTVTANNKESDIILTSSGTYRDHQSGETQGIINDLWKKKYLSKNINTNINQGNLYEPIRTSKT